MALGELYDFFGYWSKGREHVYVHVMYACIYNGDDGQRIDMVMGIMYSMTEILQRIFAK